MFSFRKLILLLLLSCPAYAGINQFFIAPSGSCNDTNAGTSAGAAWCTFGHANSTIVQGSQGTVINVASGTYAECIKTTTNGTANAPIIYVSTVQYGAVLTGVGTTCGIWEEDGSFTDIVGFYFHGPTTGNITWAISTDNGGSAVNTTNVGIFNNKMDNIEFSNCGLVSSAVILLNADSVSETIQQSNNIVDGNLINATGGGANCGGFNNSGEHGIYVQRGGDIVTNNILVNMGGGWGIELFDHSCSSTCPNNIVIANNTILNENNGGIQLADDHCNNCTIINNIIGNVGGQSGGGQHGGITLTDCTNATGMVTRNESMYSNVTGNYTASSSNCGNNSSFDVVGANAHFVNYTGDGTGDYHLTSSAPEIGAGTFTCGSGVSGCPPVRDFAGSARNPSSNDMGAYQHSASAGKYPWQPAQIAVSQGSNCTLLGVGP